MTSLMSSQLHALASQSEGFSYMSEMLETGEFQKKTATCTHVLASRCRRKLLRVAGMLPVVPQADFQLVNRVVDRPNGLHFMAAEIVRGVIQSALWRGAGN